MNLTKTMLATAVVSLFAVQPVFACTPGSTSPLCLSNGDKVKLTEPWGATYGHAYGGGEFLVEGVSVANGAGTSFLTFCLEFPEHIALNTNYYVHLNNAAVEGGGGATLFGSTPHPFDPTAKSYDPLGASTAWLYTQFRNNTLSGFNYSSNSYANSLQLAIWKLEDELTTSAAISAGAAAAYSSDTRAQAWVSAAGNSGWTDTGNVMVMNLYSSYNATTGVFSGERQDQLYLNPYDCPEPIPEPETYVMLLAGLGLMGTVARRRKKKAA